MRLQLSTSLEAWQTVHTLEVLGLHTWLAVMEHRFSATYTQKLANCAAEMPTNGSTVAPIRLTTTMLFREVRCGASQY